MLMSKLIVSDVIGQIALESPGAPALQARGSSAATYEFIVSLIDETRSFLNARGIGRGDRVAVLVSDPARAMATYLGVMNSAVAVPMSPKSTELELVSAFKDLNLAAVVLSEDLEQIASTASKAALPVFWAMQIPNVTGGFQLSGGPKNPNSKGARIRDTDIACIQTSSGSTGQAKATLQSHEVLVYRSERDRHILNLGRDDVMINFRPPYLSGPLNIGLLGTVCSGGSVVVPYQFVADDFFGDLLEFGATWYTGGPAYHRAILECVTSHPEALASHKLRFIRSAGYVLPEDLQQKLEATFGVPCIQKYGSSEAGLVSCNPLPPRKRKAGACGPVVGCEVRIVSEDETDLPANEVGEIWVRGPGVFSGYDDDLLTKASFSGDWFKTGDLGTVDEDGYLSISGRKNEIINRGGQKIAPQEVEDVYAALPGVADVMCFPIPHETLGATAGLAIIARDCAKADTEELRNLAAKSLSRFKQPETIVIVDSLPRGPTGKPLRKQAAEFFKLNCAGKSVGELGRSPKDRLEQIWCDTLKIETVHEHENFTLLGGDSLRAMRLVLRIEREFNVSLPPEVIYGKGATLSGLRASIAQAQTNGAKRRVLPKRSDPSADLPLNSSQKRIWSICKTFPDIALYNSSFGLRFPGRLDVNALQKALDMMLMRHEVLRAVFPDVGGTPLQRIRPRLSVPVEIIDFSKESTNNLDRLVKDTARELARRPYDLSLGPLVRFQALLVPDGAILLHQSHHIVGDAISTSILAREISVAYTAFKSGSTPIFPEIECSFGDFIADQANRLTEDRKDELLDFWVQELDGVETILELPADRPQPPVPSHKGARIYLNFGETIGRGLRKVAADQGTTLFATALAAFEVLIHRLTDKQNFIIGTGIDTRPSDFRDQIVGFCLNTVPLPARVRSEQSFVDLIREVHECLQRAKQHAEAPFEGIVQRMAPERRGSVLPLVQVLFGHMPRGTRPSDIPSTEAGLWNFDHDRSRFDLTVMIGETDKGLGGLAEFATDLFEPETIHRLIARYEALLEEIVADPSRALSDYPIIPEEEQRLIEGFSRGPKNAYPSDSGIADVFAKVARNAPKATAMIHGTERLTYGELDRWSDAIASRLASEGVAKGDIVGISAERTPAVIAGLLGILKVGGAYLVLDDKLPSSRLTHMLNDAEAKLVLVANASSPLFVGDVATVELTDFSVAETFEHRAVGGRDLAYLCYTSGTTGQPKGVEIEQRSVLRLVIGTDYAALGADERICQTGALGFDASTFEIWGTLLNGGTLVLPEVPQPMLSELADLIEREKITTLWLTAGLFRQIVDTYPECFRSVRQVLTGGDVASAHHVLKLKRAAPKCRVINCYGPTENTTFSICGELHRATVETGVVPIGRPIANSTAYILDSAKCLVPIGVEGDLFVGGHGVARGYRGRPDLTDVAFGADPFLDEDGARMYRTGDRARFLPDGRIEFLGRKDLQVKIRGFRIELEEIETVLRTHDSVQDSVVLARTDDDFTKTLHAFVIAGEGASPEPSELRSYLGANLPDYMVPNTFTALERFALNANGKIDRNTLLELHNAMRGRKTETEKSLPQSGIEKMLAEIWAELLPETDEIGIDDDFFGAGGTRYSFCASVSGSKRKPVCGWRRLISTRILRYAVWRRGLKIPCKRTRSAARYRKSGRTLPELRHGRPPSLSSTKVGTLIC